MSLAQILRMNCCECSHTYEVAVRWYEDADGDEFCCPKCGASGVVALSTCAYGDPEDPEL